MIFILLSWLYILFISIGMGGLLYFFERFQYVNLVFIIISGLFFQLLLLHLYAIFFPINEYFYLINIILCTGILIYRRSFILKIIKRTVQSFLSWNISIKILFIITSFIACMQASVSPNLVDNETYYIQTIKWLNEYGFVRGLANIHIFLGQMSGWHILQSSFNFAFWNNFLNDLNGFLIVVIAFFSYDRLNNFKINQNFIDLFIGIIFITSLFLYRFLDSPSPDLPVFLITLCIIYLFYISYSNPKEENIILILIFSLMLVLIKITAFPILLFYFVLWMKTKNKIRIITPFLLLSCISFLLFCIKNALITGYILYPTNLISSFISLDWKIPSQLQDMYYNITRMHPYNTLDLKEFEKWNFIDKFSRWIFMPKLHGFFNKLILILLLLFPFFIKKNKSKVWIYLYAILQFVILFILSPQYRFFFNIILTLGLIILARIMMNRSFKFTASILWISVLLTFIPLIFPLKFFTFTNNKMMAEGNVFHTYYFLKPHKNSRYTYQYDRITENNLKYNSPKNTAFWFTGDGEIPVINYNLMEYYKGKLNFRPQLRINNSIKDGFKPEILNENEDR